jgi:spore maturation protein SpmB
VLAWIGGISILIGLLISYIKFVLAENQIENFSSILSNGLILLIFLVFLLGGMYKKVNLFESFVEGAKGGFEVAIKIIPYLVAMLVAISVLRSSGAFEFITSSVGYVFSAMGLDTQFVQALPTALMKPLSGSGARAMMVDTMNSYGADSFAGRLSAIFQGTSDTTFYVVAVYFGSVAVKNTRYAIGSMLLADLVGIITSILLAYLFFGS